MTRDQITGIVVALALILVATLSYLIGGTLARETERRLAKEWAYEVDQGWQEYVRRIQDNYAMRLRRLMGEKFLEEDQTYTSQVRVRRAGDLLHLETPVAGSNGTQWEILISIPATP